MPATASDQQEETLEADYTIHDKILVKADSGKYLGVEIDQQLTWNTHINKRALKANNIRAFIQRNLHACPRDINARCYSTLVRPIVEYSSVVWDPHTQANINKLEMGQPATRGTVRRQRLHPIQQCPGHDDNNGTAVSAITAN